MAPLTRRSALHLMGTAAAAALPPLPGISKEQTRLPSFFSSVREAFDAPRSTMFGVSAEESPRDPETLYRVATPIESELSFDVSNNQILGSFTRFGELRRVCAATGVAMLSLGSMKGGVYSEKKLIRGGTWKVEVKPSGQESSSVDLAGNIFPIFTSVQQGLWVHRFVFAPCDPDDAHPPRALVAICLLRNESGREISGNLTSAAEAETAPARQSAIILGDSDFRVPARGETILAAAYLLGESDSELRELETRLRSRPLLDWLNATWKSRVSVFGRPVIPDAPYHAESVARFSENCRQSILRLPGGGVAGAFLGSDVDTRAINWVRDSFYSSLAASMFAPGLAAGAILYLLEWNLPPQAVGRGLARFADAGRVTQSLGNALAPLVLAGYYYQFTGDAAFLRAHPDILRIGRTLLDDVLCSRRGKPFLFPSMFVSDGDARGDYHTGSNIVAWKAFLSMGRLAREVYDDPESGEEWTRVAAKIRDDIRTHCIGVGPLGRQFFEGATDSRAFITGHDGEESDTTLAPFYGFCSSDDPALIRHARLAMTPMNPFYSKDLDAIWWFNEKWGSATFPGWMTALAGARDETEIAARLFRIRQLTDLDGSIWWWPYKYGTRSRSAVLRANGARKCGWASGVYLCRLMHDILGLDLDLPAQRVEFRPFCPWRRFSWQGCRIGAGVLDLNYERTRRAISASLINRTGKSLSASLELTAPLTKETGKCLVDGAIVSDAQSARRYERPSARITRTLAPGQTLLFEVRLL